MVILKKKKTHPHGFADHSDSTVAVLGQGDRCPWYEGRAGFSKSFARCVQRQVPSASAVHQQGRLHPRRGAEALSHGPDCLSYQRDSQLLDTVVDASVLQVVQDIPVVMQRPIPTISLTMEISQLLFDEVVMSLV